MKNDIAIKVEGVSKKFAIGETKNFPTLRDKLVELPQRIFKGPKKTKTFWALKDVSFEVKKGEVVGIIGRNGAGKSTLLKILARITEPTHGKITMYGRVASMLEVGTGFNPELTGRENIYLNGSIIGMKRSEIKARFDEIVEFSGVGKFLDTPVKHYSSGMYVRLAFAVAAHLDADILLVDEVLAVGDAEFQKKCLGKMSDLASSGRTVIFVSHNMNSVTSLCTKAYLLKNGRIRSSGKTKKVVYDYYQQGTSNNSGLINLNQKRKINKKSNFSFQKIHLKNSNNISTNKFFLKEKFHIQLGGELKSDSKDLTVGLTVLSQQGFPIFNTFNNLGEQNNKTYKKGKLSFDIVFDQNPLGPGLYTIGIGANGNQIIDWIPEAGQFVVLESDKDGNKLHEKYDGVITCPCHWEMK